MEHLIKEAFRRMTSEQTWQDRAIALTGGNKSAPGTVLLAMLGRSTKRPHFGREGYIDAQGMVRSSMVHATKGWFPNVPICDKITLRDTFRKIADELKLSDVDRVAMFGELKKWLTRDDSAAYDPRERLGEWYKPS